MTELIEITPEDAARRLGEGETVVCDGVRIARDWTKTGIAFKETLGLPGVDDAPSARFKSMRDIWSCTGSTWQAYRENGPLQILTKSAKYVPDVWRVEFGQLSAVIRNQQRGYVVEIETLDAGGAYEDPDPLFESHPFTCLEIAVECAEGKVKEMLTNWVNEAGGEVVWKGGEK